MGSGGEALLIVVEGPGARVTLNRPDVHKAFDEGVIAALAAALTSLSAAPEVRVIVLAGEGKSFCAGADLGWMGRMAGYSREENIEDARSLQRMYAAIDDCPKATIASVHGAALGGGAGLVAVCDIAIAGKDS